MCLLGIALETISGSKPRYEYGTWPQVTRTGMDFLSRHRSARALHVNPSVVHLSLCILLPSSDIRTHMLEMTNFTSLQRLSVYSDSARLD